MGSRYSALCLALALALTACGKQQSVDQHTAANGPAAAAPAAAVAPRSDAAGQKPAEQASDQPSKITRMNEDGSETVEDVPSDSGVHNPLLAAVASTIAASTSTASAAAAVSGSWQEGVNYSRLVPAQPTAVAAGQVEVLEFFWYACPHCYGMDPLVESWKRTKPPYVSFSRVPVLWSEGHRSLARLFYTVEGLGKLDQLHGEIFREIHVNGDTLVAANPDNQAETERIQSAFLRRFGISESDFKNAYHSMSVDLALQRADELAQRYRIDGVPRFVVNGKYIADVSSAGTPERLMSLVADLAAQEHKR